MLPHPRICELFTFHMTRLGNVQNALQRHERSGGVLRKFYLERSRQGPDKTVGYVSILLGTGKKFLAGSNGLEKTRTNRNRASGIFLTNLWGPQATQSLPPVR